MTSRARNSLIGAAVLCACLGCPQFPVLRNEAEAIHHAVSPGMSPSAFITLFDRLWPADCRMSIDVPAAQLGFIRESGTWFETPAGPTPEAHAAAQPHGTPTSSARVAQLLASATAAPSTSEVTVLLYDRSHYGAFLLRVRFAGATVESVADFFFST